MSKTFNSQLKTKGAALFIEHLPCCILSFGAGFFGLSVLNHNPVIELGFAIGGAMAGEYAGHRFFNKNHVHAPGLMPTVKRYGVSLAIGLASWGAHQYLFHDHSPQHIDESQSNFIANKNCLPDSVQSSKFFSCKKNPTPNFG